MYVFLPLSDSKGQWPFFLLLSVVLFPMLFFFFSPSGKAFPIQNFYPVSGTCLELLSFKNAQELGNSSDGVGGFRLLSAAWIWTSLLERCLHSCLCGTDSCQYSSAIPSVSPLHLCAFALSTCCRVTRNNPAALCWHFCVVSFPRNRV